MVQFKSARRKLSYALVASALTAVQATASADNSVSVRLSALSSWQVLNDVQIPNTDLGTRFSLFDAIGEGPVTSTRAELNWNINARHGIRIMLAPLELSETVTFDEPILFAGGSFNANEVTIASYRFNSWRLGYHYSIMRGDAGFFRMGATLKVRDAEIRLEQGDNVSFDDDLGLVPLLYIAGQFRIGNRWIAGADIDGLAGGPGRAIDLGVSLDYSITDRWNIGADVRALDGGADTEGVYNFARFYSAAIAISANF